MYSRSLEPLIRELLAEFRIVYLTGPRQAGKTTLARSVAESLEMAYITLDDQSAFESIESDPHGFIRALGSRRVVLDEFQYAPSLLPAIKEASDAWRPHEKGKFLLTGFGGYFSLGTHPGSVAGTHGSVGVAAVVHHRAGWQPAEPHRLLVLR